MSTIGNEVRLHGVSPDEESLDEVVLVDGADEVIGTCPKLQAHEAPGARHQAFSILLFDEDARLLLQRRAAGKYHFAGRWSNSCCGHPRPGENRATAAARRLKEELGVVVALEPGPCFEYRAQDLTSGLVEHEIDQLFWCHVGVIELQPDPRETDAWCWVDRHELQTWMQREPASFTPWFAPLLEQADGLWR